MPVRGRGSMNRDDFENLLSRFIVEMADTLWPMLQQAWQEGYGSGRDDEAAGLELKDSSPNPYTSD